MCGLKIPDKTTARREMAFDLLAESKQTHPDLVLRLSSLSDNGDEAVAKKLENYYTNYFLAVVIPV
jgi:hypothetical protein